MKSISIYNYWSILLIFGAKHVSCTVNQLKEFRINLNKHNFLKMFDINSVIKTRCIYVISVKQMIEHQKYQFETFHFTQRM